ncbi:MAG TPA: hypothetical protein PK335_00130 [Draconibacterium sp.]|nr:hypothetical protein [Draconibacterium sp.]
MKKTLFLTALMFFALVGLQAQTIDQVLGKYFQTTGQEKLATVKTYYVKATTSMMGMDMPMTIQMKKPNKFKTEMEVMGQKMEFGFDGETGWMRNPMVGSGITDLKGAELKQAIQQADLEGELYNYAAKGHSAELIGKVNLNGTEAYRIKFTNADGSVKDYYIDAKTNLLTAIKAKVESMGQAMDITQKIVEYKEVNGIKIPGKMEADTPMGTQTVVFNEIKFDEPMDDSIFVRPQE